MKKSFIAFFGLVFGALLLVGCNQATPQTAPAANTNDAMMQKETGSETMTQQEDAMDSKDQMTKPDSTGEAMEKTDDTMMEK